MSLINLTNNVAIFSISSLNYISYARTLFGSVKEFHSDDVDMYLLLVDELDGSVDPDSEPFKIIEAKNINISEFETMSFKYDIMELNTAVKPFFIRNLLKAGYKKIIYLDPDIMVFDRLDLALNLLDSHSIVLTPHITMPIHDDLRPSEQDFLKTGIYNLGFIALSNTEESFKLIEWWCLRCGSLCYNEPETGLFVDQKWINYVPGLFESVYILRNQGYNMSYWNLHERVLINYRVNNSEQLCFYHFSGICFDDLNSISKYQNRYTLLQRPELTDLFELYRDKVLANGYHNSKRHSYKYSKYEDGTIIGPVGRRLYPSFLTEYPDPFSVKGNSYHARLISKGIIEKEARSKNEISNSMTKSGKINILLKIVIKCIGVDRYILLMRYIRWVSVTRRQKFMLE